MNPIAILLSLLAALAPASAPDSVSDGEPAQVLHAWQHRREEAWLAGDPARLRALYVPGSRAGEYDVALLVRYRARGLVVRRLETQLLGLAVLVHEPGRLVLRTTERIARLSVRRGGQAVRVPEEQARTRTIELRRVSGQWRVAGVSGG